MSALRDRSLLINLVIIAVTVVFVSAMLVVGRADAEPATVLTIGEASPETYTATRGIQVTDAAATRDAKDLAAETTELQYEIDPLVRSRVEDQIASLLRAVRLAPLGPEQPLVMAAVADDPIPTNNVNEFVIEYTITVENPTTRTRSYSLELAPQYSPGVTILDVVYDQDLDSDAEPDSRDVAIDAAAGSWLLVDPATPQPLRARVVDTYTVTALVSADPDVVTDLSANCLVDDGAPGTGLRVEAMADTADLERPLTDPACRPVPALVPSAAPDPGEGDTTTTTSSTTTTSTTVVTAVTTPVIAVPREQQIAALQAAYLLYADAIPALVDAYDTHLALQDAGEDGFFPSVEQQMLDRVREELASGIRQVDVAAVRDRILSNPPPLLAPDLDAQQLDDLETAAARVLALSLEANELEDEAATAEARNAASTAVAEVVVSFVTGEPIVLAGEPITAVAHEAIRELGLLEPEAGTSRTAAAFLGGLAVLLTALFLWRIAPSRWSQPKHIALLGILMLLAAFIARLAEFQGTDNPELGYAIPAALLGYSAAILYEPRTALLTAVPMAVFTAISTQDTALTIFAAVATIAPVAFVSAVSTRRELRVAVLLSAVVLAPTAAAVSWLFNGPSSMLEAAMFGFAGGLLGGLVGQSLVAFLENLFQVTTTVTLLDLTDRNHPGLRVIEEKAPGTFNHSILVGNLAGRAARAVDANPLLAQAAAFYHDLGKTENPHFFIENQFGVSNPHDELSPVESSEIIRRHVSDGLRLAKQYRIPPDVAAGIEQHHGSGLMRYFYHKAMADDASVDPSLFRHHGRKPQRKEMAILMISDAVEGAARALAQQEDPTPDSLQKLVDSVVGEKLEDGQLDESDLTFGDLTNVKRALVEALIGYYHTRIPYPGFPGPRVEDA